MAGEAYRQASSSPARTEIDARSARRTGCLHDTADRMDPRQRAKERSAHETFYPSPWSPVGIAGVPPVVQPYPRGRRRPGACRPGRHASKFRLHPQRRHGRRFHTVHAEGSRAARGTRRDVRERIRLQPRVRPVERLLTDRAILLQQPEPPQRAAAGRLRKVREHGHRRRPRHAGRREYARHLVGRRGVPHRPRRQVPGGLSGRLDLHPAGVGPVAGQLRRVLPLLQLPNERERHGGAVRRQRGRLPHRCDDRQICGVHPGRRSGRRSAVLPSVRRECAAQRREPQRPADPRAAARGHVRRCDRAAHAVVQRGGRERQADQRPESAAAKRRTAACSPTARQRRRRGTRGCSPASPRRARRRSTRRT